MTAKKKTGNTASLKGKEATSIRRRINHVMKAQDWVGLWRTVFVAVNPFATMFRLMMFKPKTPEQIMSTSLKRTRDELRQAIEQVRAERERESHEADQEDSLQGY